MELLPVTRPWQANVQVQQFILGFWVDFYRVVHEPWLSATEGDILKWHCNFDRSLKLFHLQSHLKLAPKGVTASLRSCSDYTGYQYDSKWNLSSLSWSTRCSTTWHHRICQMIASSLPPLGIISFDQQSFKCTITCTSSHLGDREFAAAKPHLWNSLPTRVCQFDLCRCKDHCW